MDLLQNCDLPPPLKLFSPFEKDHDKRTTETEATNQTENASLLRALQLSQSRAREAEEKASIAKKDAEQMRYLMLEESSRLSAHRQWVKLLETELLLIHDDDDKKKKKKKKKKKQTEGEEELVPTLTWCLTLALCLSIGFVLGRYIL